MPFLLNEAPELALDALRKHRVKRGCGLAWSWICCLPTVGTTLCCEEDCQGEKNPHGWNGCCYPKSVDAQTAAAVTVLKSTLNSMILRPESIPPESRHEYDLRDTVKTQVENTVLLLQNALTNKLVHGTYKKVLEDLVAVFKTRTDVEDFITKNLRDVPRTVTGYQTPLAQRSCQ